MDLAEKVRALCAEHRIGIGSEEGFRELEGLPPRPSMGELESLNGHAYALLRTLPPESVALDLGVPAAFWTWMRPGGGSGAEVIAGALGENPRRIEQARLAVESQGVRDVAAVFRAYGFCREISDLLPSPEQLWNILQDSARQGIALSEKRKEAYGVQVMRPSQFQSRGEEVQWEKRVHNGARYEVYLDGPVGVGLMHKGGPIAVLSYLPMPKDTLLIVQKQVLWVQRQRWDEGQQRMVSYRAGQRGLAPLDFDAFAFQYSDQLAANAGFRRLELLQAERIGWAGMKGYNFTKKGARKVYDSAAERWGFRREGNGNWNRAVGEPFPKAHALPIPETRAGPPRDKYLLF